MTFLLPERAATTRSALQSPCFALIVLDYQKLRQSASNSVHWPVTVNLAES